MKYFPCSLEEEFQLEDLVKEQYLISNMQEVDLEREGDLLILERIHIQANEDLEEMIQMMKIFLHIKDQEEQLQQDNLLKVQLFSLFYNFYRLYYLSFTHFSQLQANQIFNLRNQENLP